MRGGDWAVVAAYLAVTLVIGVWLARRGSRSLTDYFVGGRAIPWWLAGTSMAATTFNVDTPLYVTGVVARRGIAGNWEWWSFAITHVLMAVVLARLWRRAAVITDVELTELRYAGRPAAVLRATRAFLFGLPLNCIGIGYGMLAMRKMLIALDVWAGVPLPGDPELWSVVAVAAIVLVYSAASGLWGVVATDFVQFILAMLGSLIVAAAALGEIGGLGALREAVRGIGRSDALALVPSAHHVGLPLSTFLAYLGIQWWAFRNSDGGGMFVQRLSACRDEREAEKAAGLFNVLHYVVRTWPWIVVALAALVLLPRLSDPELAYPLLMRRYLPAGLLGLVFASLVAAFMSTVSTQINWGASYVVHDLYRRFVRPDAGERHLVRIARLASVVITALAAAASFAMEDVGQVFRFVILIGNGPGLVLLLRWFWWRINAWAELSAMLAGLAVALASYLPALDALSFGARLLATAAGALVVWLPVMLLTRPEPMPVLEAFYRRARPAGPGWRAVQARVALQPETSLGRDLVRTAAALAQLFGALLGLGGIVVGSAAWAVGGAVAAAAGSVVSRALRRGERRSPEAGNHGGLPLR